MNVKSRSIIAISAAVSIILISFSACTTQQRNTPQARRTRYQQLGTPGTIGNNATGNTGMQFDATPGTNRTLTGTNLGAGNNNNNNAGNFLGMGNNNNAPSPRTNTVQNDRSKAVTIKSGLDAMPGIDNVNVVVMGNTAIVSYNRNNGTDNLTVTDQTISDRVKQIDRSITNVYTTDSANIGDQVKRLSNDMTTNRPMDEIRASFNKLINTINLTGKRRS